jgi:hypothetical protein
MTDTPARPDAGTKPEEQLRAEFEKCRAKWGSDEPAALETLERLFSGSIPLTAERERLEAENAALRLTIYELMEDLEAEIRERYNVTDGSDPHPALQRKFDRDIEPVYRARQQLRALTSTRDVQ